jgi:hypothetical protein
VAGYRKVTVPDGNGKPVLLSSFTLTLLPLKMEPIEGSETSAYIYQTPGNYPKENLL